MRKGNTMRIALTVIFLSLMLTTTLFAQNGSVRASQKGMVLQLIANGKVEIEYSRPVARGRQLFGPVGIVKFDKVWMPGANEATTINLDRDIKINGSLLKAGKYSIWTIPNEKKWTVIFSKDWDQWHSKYPGEKMDAIRIDVTPKQSSHMETLAFYFPMVDNNKAVLHLHWGKVVVPLTIEIA